MECVDRVSAFETALSCNRILVSMNYIYWFESVDKLNTGLYQLNRITTCFWCFWGRERERGRQGGRQGGRDGGRERLITWKWDSQWLRPEALLFAFGFSFCYISLSTLRPLKPGYLLLSQRANASYTPFPMQLLYSVDQELFYRLVSQFNFPCS